MYQNEEIVDDDEYNKWIINQRLFYVYNIILCIYGAVFIVFGQNFIETAKIMTLLMQNDITYVGIFLIVLGSIMFPIAILGCYGFFKKSSKTLIIFTFWIIIIFLAQLAIIIPMTQYEKTTPPENVKINSTDYMAHKEKWDYIQASFNCCGISGYDTWDKFTPLSCCGRLAIGIATTFSVHCEQEYNRAHGFIYNNGCLASQTAKFDRGNIIIIAIISSVVILEIFGTILTYWLIVTIKSKNIKPNLRIKSTGTNVNVQN